MVTLLALQAKLQIKNILNQMKIHIHRRMHFEPPFVKSKFEINSLRRGKRQLGYASKSNQA